MVIPLTERTITLNPTTYTFLRERLALSDAKLARETHTTAARIASLHRENHLEDPILARRLATALCVPIGALTYPTTPMTTYGPTPSDQNLAKATLTANAMGRLQDRIRHLTPTPPPNLPTAIVHTRPTTVAHTVRKDWGFTPKTPLPMLTHIAERNGYRIGYLPHGATSRPFTLYHRAVWAGQPLIMLNPRADHARQRFCLATQIGYLMLNYPTSIPTLQEKRNAAARAFARELLAPTEHTALPPLDSENPTPETVKEITATAEKWGIPAIELLKREYPNLPTETLAAWRENLDVAASHNLPEPFYAGAHIMRLMRDGGINNERLSELAGLPATEIDRCFPYQPPRNRQPATPPQGRNYAHA